MPFLFELCIARLIPGSPNTGQLPSSRGQGYGDAPGSAGRWGCSSAQATVIAARPTHAPLYGCRNLAVTLRNLCRRPGIRIPPGRETLPDPPPPSASPAPDWSCRPPAFAPPRLVALRQSAPPSPPARLPRPPRRRQPPERGRPGVSRERRRPRESDQAPSHPPRAALRPAALPPPPPAAAAGSVSRWLLAGRWEGKRRERKGGGARPCALSDVCPPSRRRRRVKEAPPPERGACAAASPLAAAASPAAPPSQPGSALPPSAQPRGPQPGVKVASGLPRPAPGPAPGVCRPAARSPAPLRTGGAAAAGPEDVEPEQGDGQPEGHQDADPSLPCEYRA